MTAKGSKQENWTRPNGEQDYWVVLYEIKTPAKHASTMPDIHANNHEEAFAECVKLRMQGHMVLRLFYGVHCIRNFHPNLPEEDEDGT